jgi:tRNA(Ile)-lysidine synthase
LLNYTALDSQLHELLAAPAWYVGFSGGMDSTVLLHLLHAWRAANAGAPPLTAIHINHGLQPGAADWQAHCASVCCALGVALTSSTVVVGDFGSGEAAARAARYQAFAAQLPPDAVLFLGHHLDDQVETFFLRLLRGAGVEGLAAMGRQRTLGSGLLVRPLLDHTRRELEEYAEHHALAHVHDPSNADTTIDRNFVRAQLLPLLASRWPSYRQTIARASEHLAAAARTLTDHAGVPETVHTAMGDPGLLRSALLEGSVELGASRLRAWLRARACLLPDSATMVEFLRQLRTAAADASPRLTVLSYSLQRYREGIYLLPEFAGMCPTVALKLTQGERQSLPGVGTVSLLPAVDAGVWLAPGEQLTLQWRQPGLRCRLPGRAGSRELKALLQELGIPPWWRERVPLLYLGDELLAIADLARCESDRWSAGESAGRSRWKFAWERHVGAGSV